MGRVIWKFAIPVRDEVTIEMPADSVLLTVASQNDHPHVWAMVDPSARHVRREFSIRPTGADVGEVGDYVGTFFIRGGQLVFHLFEAA